MKDNSTVIGIDIGGTKISSGLFLPNGDILRKEIRFLDGRKGKQVIQIIGIMLESLIHHAKIETYKVVAIGVCVPGIYNPIKKTAWAPNIPEWNNIPLWGDLTDIINDSSIKIVIESDRSCYILGEIWKGCAKGCTDAIFIAVGTGIGAGILSNGKIIRGNSGIGGAIGWLAMKQPYKSEYDTCGNFEYYASGNGLVRSAVEILTQNKEKTSSLDSIPFDEITARDIFKAFEKQDPVAIAVIHKAINYWGMTVANLVSIFNPQKVIFGGGVFGPAGQFLTQIFNEAKKWAQPLSIKEVSLEVSNLEGDAGLIGAGYLAIMTLNDQTYGK